MTYENITAAAKELREAAEKLRDGELTCEPIEQAKIYEQLADFFDSMMLTSA